MRDTAQGGGATNGTRTRLGFVPTLGIAIGTTVGAGVFAFSGPAAAQAGALLPWAFVLGLIPILFALAPVAMLAAALPTQGGNYRYPSRLLSPKLAFLGAWTYAFGAFFGFFPLYALSCVDYLQQYVPGLAPRPTAFALLTLFYLFNLRGLTLAATVQAVLVGVLVSALTLYAAIGLGHLEPANLRLPHPAGTMGMITGASLLTFAYMGCNALVELGHEIRDPARTIPRAMALCLAIVLVLYVAVGTVTVGVVPWNIVADRDLAEAARAFLGEPLLAFFVLGGAVTALTTTLNASFLWGTKSLQVLCQDGFLPRRWGASHARYGTPHWILTGIWALSVVGLLLPFERATLNAYATIGGLAIFVPVLMASALLPRRCPRAYAASRFRLRGPMVWLAPGVGVLLCVGAMATLVVEMVDRTALLLLLAWIAGGALYVQRASRHVQITREPGWE